MDLTLSAGTRATYLDALARFGSPLFVYDGSIIEARYRQLRQGLPPAVDIYYSLKANPNVSVCALLARGGAGAEVSSLAELKTALRAGVAPEKIIFLGPGKSAAELEACVALQPRLVIVESLQELAELEALAGAAQRCLDILLRVNPLASGQHRGLSMGGKPRQFGIDEDILLASAGGLSSLRWLRVRGLHVFFGSRFLDEDEIVANTQRVFDLVPAFEAASGIAVDTIDIGGGFGVAYYPGEPELDTQALLSTLRVTIGRFLAERPSIRLITEQGRFLTAESGVYLTTVRYTKLSRGEQFAVVDGGTHHHLHAVGVGNVLKKDFPLVSLADPAQRVPVATTVAGPLCTPADVLARKVTLPRPEPGDVLVVLRSGAYGPTASPGLFLGHGHPAEVLLVDGEPQLVRRRDTPEDVLAAQILTPLLFPHSHSNEEVSMSRLSILQRIAVVVTRITGREVGAVSDSTLVFDELGLDSISVLEVLVALEGEFGIEVDPEELQPENLETLGAVATYVQSRSTQLQT